MSGTTEMTEKTTTPPAAPQAKRRILTPYVMIWAGLASLSVAYLALLVMQPNAVAGMLGAKTEASAAAETERVLQDAQADIKQLRESVDQVREQIITLRTDLTAKADRDRELMDRVAALEAAPEPQVTNASAKNAKTQKGQPLTPAAAAAAKKQAPAPVAAAQPAPAAPAAPGVVTGSVAAPAAIAPPAVQPAPAPAATAPAETPAPPVPGAVEPINFGPAVVTPAPAAKTAMAAPAAVTPAAPAQKALGVQIANGPSIDSLRLSWTLLSERHNGTIGRLQPRYTVGATEQGMSYGLVAGPITTAEEARAICQELISKATPCSLTPYRGDAL